jgi:hypothetical protein
VLSEPSDGAAFPYRSAPPRIRFGWTTREQDSDFRLTIATDPDFEDLVYEALTDDTEFVHGYLTAGRYYWRVHGVREGAAGAPSTTRSLLVSVDNEPPALLVQFPETTVDGTTFLLTGTTEPGSRVLLGDQELPTDDSGAFRHQLQLRQGYNFVIVQAVDASGNTSFQSRVIDARF